MLHDSNLIHSFRGCQHFLSDEGEFVFMWLCCSPWSRRSWAVPSAVARTRWEQPPFHTASNLQSSFVLCVVFWLLLLFKSY